MYFSFKEKNIQDDCEAIWEQVTKLTRLILTAAASGKYKLNREYLSDIADAFKQYSLDEYRNRNDGSLYVAKQMECGVDCEALAERIDDGIYENIIKEITDTLKNCRIVAHENGESIKQSLNEYFTEFAATCRDNVTTIRNNGGDLVNLYLWVLVRDNIAKPLKAALDKIDEPVKAENNTGIDTELLAKLREYSNNYESILNKIKTCQYVDDRDIYKNFKELHDMKDGTELAELKSLIHKYDMLMSGRETAKILLKDVSDLFDFE